MECWREIRVKCDYEASSAAFSNQPLDYAESVVHWTTDCWSNLFVAHTIGSSGHRVIGRKQPMRRCGKCLL